MQSASSPAQPDQPPVRFCPCGLTREEVKEYKKFDERLKCTAEWADDSGKICEKPLGAHPRERDLNPPPAQVPRAGEPTDATQNLCDFHVSSCCCCQCS
jgi:hypothetical protein